ncbi:MAG TPA: GNAT family N-acetyltransferase [Frankiaceae bacterium]|jgi:GNAT superfamily N-acetyltransferase|nr:GNAT family N-acetyltransferase [Frankiaceae bacterium]
MNDALRIVPANDATWDDIQTVFGQRGVAARCQCQRFKWTEGWWEHAPREVLAAELRDQVNCGVPGADTAGLVAYLGDEPVGWCAVEPRPMYGRLLRMPVPWKGRPEEDRNDPDVWAATCFAVRAGYRRRGYSYALAAAAVDHARDRGAKALEAYPMITKPGQNITWGEVHVGSRNMFVAAGLKQVTHPTLRRVVMRIDF